MPPLQEQSNKKSPWAMIIIFIVIITLGLFLFWQRKTNKDDRIETTPVATPSPTAPANDLEASAANISIPNFEDAL